MIIYHLSPWYPEIIAAVTLLYLSLYIYELKTTEATSKNRNKKD